MATITKRDMIEKVANSSEVRRQDVHIVIQRFLDQIIDELKAGNRLEFRDFGIFEVRDRGPRMAQNPKTLEQVTVAARRVVKFKVGRLMRESVQPKGSVLSKPKTPAKPATPSTQLTEVKLTPAKKKASAKTSNKP